MAVLSTGYRPLASCPAQRAGAQRLCAMTYPGIGCLAGSFISVSISCATTPPVLKALRCGETDTPCQLDGLRGRVEVATDAAIIDCRGCRQAHCRGVRLH